MNKGTCTLCFAVNIKIFKLKEINLQSVYEQISGVKIEYEAYYLCYICRARLHQCYLLVQQILHLHKDMTENNIHQNKCEPLVKLTAHRCKDISIGLPAEQKDLNKDVHIKQEVMSIAVKHELDTDCSDTEEPQVAVCFQKKIITNNVENDECSVKGEMTMDLPTLEINKNNILLDIVLPDSITVTRKQASTKINTSGIDKSGRDKSYIDKSDMDDSGIDKKFRCDICDKAFKRSTYVTTHKRIHIGDKPYACDVCQERFRHQSHLTTHKRKHTGAKPYTCRFCQKKFSHSSSLLMHTKTHTRDKPFACDVCEKKFHRRHDLKTHNRIHNGEKPYACDVCGKRFTHVSHLITHKRTHTGVKPYHCEVCKKRFKHSSGVKKHMITKHKGSYILGV